jgi:hypothetical protein
VNYNQTDGWNPRADRAPDRIIEALRLAKGDRGKAFDALKKNVWDFVDVRVAKADRRPLVEAHKMLRYRISRTAWDFAIRTGQHEKAENRAEYGTAGTGAGTWKPANGSQPKKKAPVKAVRAPRSASKAKKAARPAPAVKKAQKASQAPVKRPVGRPKSTKGRVRPTLRAAKK